MLHVITEILFLFPLISLFFDGSAAGFLREIGELQKGTSHQ